MGNGRLFVYTRDTATSVEVGFDSGTTQFEHRWSPDSQLIAVGLGSGSVCTAPMGAKEFVAAPATSPAWSPDAKRLVVRREQPPPSDGSRPRTRFDLAVMRRDGSSSRVLVADEPEHVTAWRGATTTGVPKATSSCSRRRATAPQYPTPDRAVEPARNDATGRPNDELMWATHASSGSAASS